MDINDNKLKKFYTVSAAIGYILLQFVRVHILRVLRARPSASADFVGVGIKRCVR